MKNVTKLCYAGGKLDSYVLQELKRHVEIQNLVIVTFVLIVILFLLDQARKPLSKVWLRLLSSFIYVVIIMSINYLLGRIGRQENAIGGEVIFPREYVSWVILLIHAYGTFDNSIAFNLQEINNGLQLSFQFLGVFCLLVIFFSYNAGHIANFPNLPSEVAAYLLYFVSVCFKIFGRLLALALASSKSPIIRKHIRSVIDFANKEDDENDAVVNPITMQGIKYMVGPDYSTSNNDRITVEKIWECNGSLLRSHFGGGDPKGELKDTCLSFALFWLILGRFFRYPIYKQDNSKQKARMLMLNGLLAEGGRSERIFRVIQVELSFLKDYFYSKKLANYLSWNLLPIPPLALMLAVLGLFRRRDDKNIQNDFQKEYCINPHITSTFLTAMIAILFGIEVTQFIMLLTSKWMRVIGICCYVKDEISQNRSWRTCLVEKFIRYTSHISISPKEELGQYCILDSRTCLSLKRPCWSVQKCVACFGFPCLFKFDRGDPTSIRLPEDVKRAICLWLQTYDLTLLSNGRASLGRNHVDQFLSWSCNLEHDSVVILVWHIATSMCCMKYESAQPHGTQTTKNFNVATSLSKYCAYLLLFYPSLLCVPSLESDHQGDTTVKEAIQLFERPSSSELVDRYDMLRELYDEEVGVEETTLRKGARLGVILMSSVEDEGDRWRVMADFWVEAVIYLARSTNNEMAHAEILIDRAELITQLWAILIHVGMVD